MTFFLVYAALLLGMGLLEALRESRAKSGRDAFFVNSRASGPWQVGISIIASCVGGSATLGMAGLALAGGNTRILVAGRRGVRTVCPDLVSGKESAGKRRAYHAGNGRRLSGP